VTSLREIVIVPGDDVATVVTSRGSEQVPIRLERGFDRFAAALAGRTPVAVRVVDGPAPPETGEGAIVVCRPAVLERGGGDLAAARTVVIDIDRTRALDWAERRGLAAAIDSLHFFGWRAGAGAPGPAALYGRRDVARRLGATWHEGPPFAGEHHVLLSDPRHPELPDLLAAYLTEYARGG
jgi:hypothetical protein